MSPTPKFKVGDPVRVVRDPLGIEGDNSFIGKTARISMVYRPEPLASYRCYRIVLDEDRALHLDDDGSCFGALEFDVDDDDIIHINGLRRFLALL